MKSLVIILFCFLNLNAFATHYLSYYVYVQKEYVQGPWKRIDLLNSQDYKYLEPHFHEDLLGTLDEDLIHTLLGHLKALNPEFYNWEYEVEVVEDTVYIKAEAQMAQFETVKNEVIATLTLNGFNSVCFSEFPIPNTYTLEDVSIPYFDLTKNGIPSKSIKMQPNNQLEIYKEDKTNKETEQVSFWLVTSLIMNAIFFIVLVFKS